MAVDSEGLEADLVDLRLDGILKNEWIEPNYKLKENEFIEIYQILKFVRIFGYYCSVSSKVHFILCPLVKVYLR